MDVVGVIEAKTSLSGIDPSKWVAIISSHHALASPKPRKIKHPVTGELLPVRHSETKAEVMVDDEAIGSIVLAKKEEHNRLLVSGDLASVHPVAEDIAYQLNASFTAVNKSGFCPEECASCNQRTRRVKTDRSITESELFDSWEVLRRQHGDVVSGPAGMNSMIIIERPLVKITRPAWLFDDPTMRLIPGLVVDRLVDAECSACKHRTIDVTCRIVENHPDREQIRKKANQLQCPECGTSLDWEGNLWRDADTMPMHLFCVLARCQTCDADIKLDPDLAMVAPDDS